MSNDMKKLFKKTKEYAIKNEIKTIVIFAKETKNVLLLNEMLEDSKIKLIVTTFPMNSTLFLENDEGRIEEYYPELNNEEGITILKNKGIEVIASTLPLESIVVPGAKDNFYALIKSTLNLFGRGTDINVQSALMVADNGAVKPGERILSLNATTAIDVRVCNSRFMFHPSTGLEIYGFIK